MPNKEKFSSLEVLGWALFVFCVVACIFFTKKADPLLLILVPAIRIFFDFKIAETLFWGFIFYFVPRYAPNIAPLLIFPFIRLIFVVFWEETIQEIKEP